MRTHFTGTRLLSFKNPTKWTFEFLSFTIPLILTIFFDTQMLKIILPCIVILLPFLSEVICRVIISIYLKRKLYKVLKKNPFKISAIGMYIIPNFRNNPDEFNSKIQTSEKYLINIKIIFNYWNASLKLVGETFINEKNSSSFSSTKVDVQFDSDNSIKICYLYKNEYIHLIIKANLYQILMAFVIYILIMKVL